MSGVVGGDGVGDSCVLLACEVVLPVGLAGDGRVGENLAVLLLLSLLSLLLMLLTIKLLPKVLAMGELGLF